ncbi:hypothetical protein D3C85_861230 [compost metagenome]
MANVQLPESMLVVTPAGTPSTNTVTVEPISAVPRNVGLRFAPGATGLTTGAAGTMVSTVQV